MYLYTMERQMRMSILQALGTEQPTTKAINTLKLSFNTPTTPTELMTKTSIMAYKLFYILLSVGDPFVNGSKFFLLNRKNIEIRAANGIYIPTVERSSQEAQDRERTAGRNPHSTVQDSP
jgi:hypothetical protein